MSVQLTLLPASRAPLPEPGRRGVERVRAARRVLHGCWPHDARTVEEFAAGRAALANATNTNNNRSTT